MKIKKMNKKVLLKISVYYLIAIILRFVATKTELLSQIDNQLITRLLRGIGPTIGAIVVIVLFGFKFTMGFKGFYKNIYIPLAVFWIVPIIIIYTHAHFHNKDLSPLDILVVLIYGLLEEIGWRGYLQQELKILPKKLSILIIAILWYFWHLNFDFGLNNLFFFFILVLGAWGIGLVAEKTNSLLAVSAFHSLNNFYSEWDVSNLSVLGILLIIWITFMIYQKKIRLKKENSTELPTISLSDK